MNLNLALIEGRWFRRGNTSVKGLFDTLADIHTNNPSSYHYEMFNNIESLKEILSRVSGHRHIQRLYIDCHGDEQALYGSDERPINRNTIRTELRRLNNDNGRVLKGIYFGSCGFLNEENAEFILAPQDNAHLKLRWLCGYSEDIGWIESSSLDLLFFNTYYDRMNRHPDETEAGRIYATAEKIKSSVPGLIRDLGFGIYVRKKGVGGVKNLLT